MASRRANTKLPMYTLLKFKCDGKTVVKMTEGLKWIERGKSCKFVVQSEELVAEVLAMKGNSS